MAVVVGLAGCEMETKKSNHPGNDIERIKQLGYDRASSGLNSGNDGHAIEKGDLVGTAVRGKHLAKLERILALGMRGIGQVGTSAAATLMPRAEVDGGGQSGQVIWYRWLDSDLGEDKELKAEGARRWLLVPVLLDPDRVLEVEQTPHKVEYKHDEYYKVEAMLLAASQANAKYPSGRWGIHAYREIGTRSGKNMATTRVYLLARDPGTPDLEIVVADARKKGEHGEVIAVNEVHAAGGWEGQEIQLQGDEPSPLTVARAAIAGTTITARTKAGTVYVIDGKTGEITPPAAADAGAAAPPAEPPP